MQVFIVSGVVFLVVGLTAASLFRNPPPGYLVPARQRAAKSCTDTGYSPSQVVAMPQFYLLWLQLFVNVIAGITIISNAVFVLADLTRRSPAAIAPLFGLVSIFNALGRLLWGAISDRIGCNHTFAVMFAVQAVTVLLLAHTHALVPALAAVSVILLCCGGGFGTMPSYNAHCFGTRFMGLNYGLILSAWGCAALVGPIIVARAKDLTGSFAGMLPLIALLLLVSIILPYITKKPVDAVGAPIGSGTAVRMRTRAARALRVARRGVTAVLWFTVIVGLISCGGGGGNTPNYVLTGTVSGLSPGQSVVLQNYGAETTTVSANGSFNFSQPFPGGAPYSVTVLTQPSGENCAIVNGSGTGTVGPGIVVPVVCVPLKLSVSGTVQYATGPVILQLANANDITMTIGAPLTVTEPQFNVPAPYTFGASAPYGTAFNVNLVSSPANESCFFTGIYTFTGTIDATNVSLQCGAPISPVTSGLLPNLSLGVLINSTVPATITSGGCTPNAPPVQTCVSTVTPSMPYTITITSQPPGETCTVGTQQGTYGAPGGFTLPITCTPSVAGAGWWTWESGSNTTANSAMGVYGTQGTAASGNVPGGREAAFSWADSAGNLWMFGGIGPGNSGVGGSFNDLWRYSPSTGMWTWISGADTLDAPSVYGTKGTAAAGNVPSAREGGAAWRDAAGNLWLFGGGGFDSTGSNSGLNDLWQYSPGTGLWAWMNGPTTGNQGGVYGTKGTAAAGNVPGARSGEVFWTDSVGDFWLFGGGGSDSADRSGYLNDLWRYNPSIGMWTWMGGSTQVNTAGTYGTEGTPAAGNVPGARFGGVSWIDAAGDFWLFGGHGYDSTGNVGSLNDLWRYSPSTGQWTWMSGSTLQGAAGVYGTEGTAATSNVPGAREDATCWIDTAGNLWLFGAGVFDSNGNLVSVDNDLWRYSPGTDLWTWMGGSMTQGAPGVYGTEGVAAAGDVPGGRDIGISWTDSSGNFWLFGGYVPGAALNDLWKYVPPGP
jgi:N-acetylneuraminic acid mutarotase